MPYRHQELRLRVPLTEALPTPWWHLWRRLRWRIGARRREAHRASIIVRRFALIRFWRKGSAAQWVNLTSVVREMGFESLEVAKKLAQFHGVSVETLLCQIGRRRARHRHPTGPQPRPPVKPVPPPPRKVLG